MLAFICSASMGARWNFSAPQVSNSPEWKQIRQLSSVALEAFSWSHQKNVGRSVKEDELFNFGQTRVPR
jgi:hypothetical protein